MVSGIIKRLFDKLFKTNADTTYDRRKKEHGNLNEINYQRRTPSSVRRHRLNRKTWNKYRVPLEKPENPLLSKFNIGNSLNHFIKNLKFIFSNDAENITNMRVACENFSLLSNNPNDIHDNNYANRSRIIRERIKQSRSFKKKLAERDYDRRQLSALKRSLLKKDRNYPYSLTSCNDFQLNNDKILLLQRQNKRLKKELLERESELRILKKEIRFLQKNSKIMNRDAILNLLSADSNEINKIYEAEHNANRGRPIDKIKDNIIEERSRSFSPVQVDYSQYSQ